MIEILLQPGDTLSWHKKPSDARKEKSIKYKKGIVLQVTGSVIAIKTRNYPDTILVNDLICSTVKITRVDRQGLAVIPYIITPDIPKDQRFDLSEVI